MLFLCAMQLCFFKLKDLLKVFLWIESFLYFSNYTKPHVCIVVFIDTITAQTGDRDTVTAMANKWWQ